MPLTPPPVNPPLSPQVEECNIEDGVREKSKARTLRVIKGIHYLRTEELDTNNFMFMSGSVI